MKKAFDVRLVTILFLVIVSVMTFIVYITVHSFRILNISGVSEKQTREILYESEQVISSLKDVETSTRGFILTGEESFLEPYNRANPQVMLHIENLRRIIGNNSEQIKIVDSLSYFAGKRLDNSISTIVLRRAKNFSEADLRLLHQGKIYMDHLRELIDKLKADEEKILAGINAANAEEVDDEINIYIIALTICAVCLIGGFVFVKNKLTERQRAEEEFKELLDSAPDAIVVVNKKGIIELVNKQTEKIFGYQRNEMVGNNVEMLIPGEFHGRHVGHRTKYFKDPNVRPMGIGLELFGQRKDESLFPVEISLSPIKTESGEVVSAAIRDISEKKKIQEELARLNVELEQKVMERTAEIADYKYALDESCIVAITDQKGIIKYANENFCRISKYSEEELVGNDHRIVNSGYHSHEFIRNLWVTISNGNIWRGELKNRAKDNGFYWVDTTIVPFLNSQGKPYQYVAIRSDITLRKKIEEELNTMNTELEGMVKERTVQLEQVNEELEAFTYSVSHDLRAPLRIIDGYADILITDHNARLNDESRRILGVIMSNARHMGQLIDDLLNLSRIGRKEIKCLLIDMNELVQEVFEERQLFSTDKIKLITGNLESCYCDRGLTKQVWTNLISNAVKYSSLKEEAVVEIGSFHDAEETIYMVKDNGVGFNMNYSSKLFGVFQRLHKISEYPGTGVGLAIVKRIVLNHNGRVWANAEPDRGATFYFSIPDQENL
ncbi:MAG: PAS domain S-box protein [Bacteroidota bacterium]